MPIPPPLSTPVEWLFIDVGGVLLDDTPLMNALYRYFARWLTDHGIPRTEQELLRIRDRLEAQGQDQVYKKVLAEAVPDDTTARQALKEFRDWLAPRQFELNPLIAGVPEALEVLASRYKLALAANQGAYIHEILERHSIHHFFTAAAIAGELGVSKPDPRFFDVLFNITRSNPAHAVMIGDSIPNDIQPARSLGMRTIYVIEKRGKYTPETWISASIAELDEAPNLLISWETTY